MPHESVRPPRGSDVLIRVAVTQDELKAGIDRTITLEEHGERREVRFRVRGGVVQYGTRVRLEGKGGSEAGVDVPGDLYVELVAPEPG